MNNKEAQENESIALENIYDRDVLFIDRSTELVSGRFLAHPVLHDSYYVKYRVHGVDENGFQKFSSFNVKYLPPITLHFQFHHLYPSKSHPAFLISCSWLYQPQLESLCEHLERLWKEGQNEVILYIWMQFLQDEALYHLGLQDCLDVSANPGLIDGPHIINRKSQKEGHASFQKCFFLEPYISRGRGKYDRRVLCLMHHNTQLSIVRQLKDYSEQKLKISYDNKWFLCDVCMEEKQGRFFMRFSECQHMYCNDCMKSYFEVQINDGTVSSITCPFDKCSTQALPSQIRELVGPDLYARYDQLLLTATLDTMTDVMYCPRVFCQCPVMLEPDRSMAICPSCQFVFCIYCKMVYHGVASCRFKKEERKKIREEYLNSSKDERDQLERRYGRRSLQMLVDETLSEEWLESNSKKCPDCNSLIEKFEGCNKITCWRCGSYFCWLCMKKLETANPYNHYSKPNSPCYNQLFQGVEFENDEDWEVGAFL